MRPCQNAMIGCRPARTASAYRLSPSARQRSVRPSAATNGYAAAAIARALRKSFGVSSGTRLHAFVARPAATFGWYPIDDLIRVHDVARLAVHAIRGVDLQPASAVAD